MSEHSSVASRRTIIGICLMLIATALVAGGLVGLVLTFTSSSSSSPHADTQETQDNRATWANNGTGLAITVMNSCDESWTPIFNVYIHAWDNGTPDALTLTTENHPHDPECEAHIGRINVCNGDYGNTDWQGVARTFRRATGFVLSSTAMLNDYHLKEASLAQRLYTMCHEQGHAYGLDHTDENHYNVDLGECMDYTAKYSNNLMPGQVNFDRLYHLYGSVNTDASTLAVQARNNSNRGLAVNQQYVVPRSVMKKYKAVVKCLESMSSSGCMEQLPFVKHDGVRMLHQSDHEETCEFSFDGYVVQSHKLLVT